MIWITSWLFFFSFFVQPTNIVSLKMEAKTLNAGKVVTSKGEVHYRNSDGLMVTHFGYPFEYFVFVNSKGEVKMYDPVNNTIMLKSGADLSSENSFFFQFLNGGTSDMGLKKSGYTIMKTRKEASIIITEWKPRDTHSQLSKIELAHENNLPVSMFLYGKNGSIVQKIFYSKYSKVGPSNLPLNITEIAFSSKSDSTITKRWYSVPTAQDKIDPQFLNYKVPPNAQVIN
jgi:hypothetical protein